MGLLPTSTTVRHRAPRPKRHDVRQNTKRTPQDPEQVADGVLVFRRLLTRQDVETLRTTPLPETSRKSLSLEDLFATLHSGRPSHFIESSTPRNGGRFEIKLSSCWADQSRRLHRGMDSLVGIAEYLKSTHRACAHARLRWHVMRVDPNAGPQQWHVDQNAKKCYWTILVPLTPDPPQSGTAFRIGRTETVLNPYLGAVCFRGNVKHRGTAHASRTPRFFLYGSLTTNDDWN